MTDEDIDQSTAFRQLKWSLHGLALAGAEQLALFPDSVVKIDELAFNLEHWAGVVRERYADELTAAQRDALEALEGKLATMSHDRVEYDAELWTESALATSEHWADVRRLASAALDAFGGPEPSFGGPEP